MWSQKEKDDCLRRETQRGESKERQRDRDSLPPVFLCLAMIASEEEKWITLLLQHFLIWYLRWVAPALNWARVCTLVLCHKTLDAVAAIHFCMVILKHTSYSGHQGTSLQIFYLGYFIERIIIHWCIFSSFSWNSWGVADWIKGISIFVANLFCLHFHFPWRNLCSRVINNISVNETKWIWMLVTADSCQSLFDNTICMHFALLLQS